MRIVIHPAVVFVAVSLFGCTQAPTSNFGYAVSENGTVMFADSSLNAEVYYWEFGDGSSDRTKSPVHRYALNGTYQVRLNTTNGDQHASSTRSVTVTNVPEGTYYFWTTSTESVPIQVFVDGVRMGAIGASESNCLYGRGYEVVVRAAAGTHRISATGPNGRSWKESPVPIAPGETRCMGLW